MNPSSILIVDDDDDIRETLRDLLEDEGYQVLEASNGREALARLRHGSVCVVLLDLMMPIMDGWEFREEQLADPAIASVPVVIITASGRTNGSLGGVDILKKPLRVETVLEVVAARC